jgi:hypothetical protein
VAIGDKHVINCQDAEEELPARLVNAGSICLNKWAKPGGGGSTLGSVETTTALLLSFWLHNIVPMGMQDIQWLSSRGSKRLRYMQEHGA